MIRIRSNFVIGALLCMAGLLLTALLYLFGRFFAPSIHTERFALPPEAVAAVEASRDTSSDPRNAPLLPVEVDYGEGEAGSWLSDSPGAIAATKRSIEIKALRDLFNLDDPVVVRYFRWLQAVANYPWLLMPVIPVVVTVLAFNLLGDGLRDAADPYSSG